MLDIKFVRENPEAVKQNIKNKFQDEKLPLVDQVLELDQENRQIKQELQSLQADRNRISKEIGKLMGQGKKEEAEEAKKQVAGFAARMDELAEREKSVEASLKEKMMVIPNIIDPSVPIGKDDSENVEVERFGEPVVPDFEIPYGDYGKIQRHRHGRRGKSGRKRFLLSDGRYRQTSLRGAGLRP